MNLTRHAQTCLSFAGTPSLWCTERHMRQANRAIIVRVERMVRPYSGLIDQANHNLVESRRRASFR
jgi:hypothetical protein